MVHCHRGTYRFVTHPEHVTHEFEWNSVQQPGATCVYKRCALHIRGGGTVDGSHGLRNAVL